MANNSILIQTKMDFEIKKIVSWVIYLFKKTRVLKWIHIHIFLNGRVYPFEGGFKKF